MAEQAPSRGLGRVLLLVGGAILAHAGYSIYELQVVLRESGGHFSPLQTTATPEAFLGLLIVICGVSLTATPFKEVSWESEMRRKTIKEMSFSPGFINLQESRTAASSAAAAVKEVPDSSTPGSAAIVDEAEQAVKE